MLFEDRSRAESFGEEAERYDRVRPSYPSALLGAVLEGRRGRVLDVGCGTGIAARLFADRGCSVLGVEADARMATIARGHGLTVEVARFEDWHPGDRTFDFLISGQAWHWVDPFRGAAKAAEVLEPGGKIALFWNVARLPPPVKTALDAVYKRVAPDLDGHSILLGYGGRDRFEAADHGVERSKAFSKPTWQTFEWLHEYTTETWIDHLPSHSDHAALRSNELDQLLGEVAEALDAVGGRFTMTYETQLLTAEKQIHPPPE